LLQLAAVALAHVAEATGLVLLTAVQAADLPAKVVRHKITTYILQTAAAEAHNRVVVQVVLHQVAQHVTAMLVCHFPEEMQIDGTAVHAHTKTMDRTEMNQEIWLAVTVTVVPAVPDITVAALAEAFTHVAVAVVEVAPVITKVDRKSMILSLQSVVKEENQVTRVIHITEITQDSAENQTAMVSTESLLLFQMTK
jgi:hypothetical protein